MSAAGGGGSAGLTVVKGHGTENDFVLVVDLDGTVDLNPRLVRALCDRRAGVGGDGVLRVVRTERLVGGTTVAPGTEFFMDYRNADGSIAEMCGNGLRVFVRYLFQSGMITGTTAVIGTRAGALPTTVEPDGRITVVLGLPGWPSARPSVRVAGLAAAHPCVAVTMPNPHLVVELVSRAELDALDLSHPPHVDPPLP
ncbi:MAG: diaminopimelate epimerase, partial [Actinomycetota bacterium]|nr:diaminopimelate epimerase [Actinomycetota bacterium]